MGVRVIRADRVEFEQGRFKDANKDLTITLRVSRIMALLMPHEPDLELTTVGIVWFGSKRIDMGHMA